MPTPEPRRPSPHRSRVLAVVALAALLVGATACSSSGTKTSGSGSSGDSGTAAKVDLRLGYFPNITHATAIVGIDNGYFQKALGTSATLKPQQFADGTAASEAILSDAIDMSYVGPNPAINSFQKTKGKDIRVISGATSGGALLVVKPAITSAKDLKGKKLATPKLGNTQDVALRAWLKKQGLSTDSSGGGDVSIQPHENADTLTLFKSGDIDGAWVPEPWATRLVQEGKGKVLVDEASLWPKGQFSTTLLMVRTDYLDKHPDVVKKFLEGQVTTNAWVNANTAEAQKVVGDGIQKLTTKALPAGVIAAAWKNLKFTNDPLASTLQKDADDAKSVGLLDDTNLKGLFDLSLLDQVLKAQNQPEVASS